MIQLLSGLLIFPISLLALNYVRKRHRELLAYRNHLVEADVPWSLMLMIVLSVAFIPLLPGLNMYLAALMPFLIVLGAIMVFLSQRIDIEQLWIGGKLPYLFVLKWMIIIYLALPLPMALLAALSTLILHFVGIETDAQDTVQHFLTLENTEDYLSFVIYACAIAPVLEEIFFRGFLFPIMKKRAGSLFAYLVTAILFGAVHGHLPSFIPLSFLGLVLAWLYDASGRLWLSVLLHALFNSISLALLFVLKMMGILTL
ncbi:MAG: type II CAAX endopeptidase family protein [Verrucomicrobiota bacterium]